MSRGPDPVDEASALVVLPIEDSIDLHTFAPAEIPGVVADYLEAAASAGFREVRIVHGRGIGVQRAAVRRVLADHPLVAQFAYAPPERGGLGATLVRLRSPRDPTDDDLGR